ncbi:MAG: prenyltransferase/squalene oxidase repeat-containing protein, partial [Pirellulales bacterium]
MSRGDEKRAESGVPDRDDLLRRDTLPAGRDDRRRLHLTWLRDAASWSASLLVHMVLLVTLGMWGLQTQRRLAAELEVVPNAASEERLDEMISAERPDLEIDRADRPRPLVETPHLEQPDDVTLADDRDMAATQVALSDVGDELVESNDLLLAVEGTVGDGLQGRGEKARVELVRKFGGTVGSERAVFRALRWLDRHQFSDGGWSLDHRRGRCQGRCPDPGLNGPSRNGATALALLPFLGAGDTHKEGEHQKTVEEGLSFLLRSMKVSNNTGSFHETGGNMYSHGLASITLCEAYAMTRDRRLFEPAQLAINFIVAAQDPVGGGWRYFPQQPGDTSVVGWQLMALKSGHMAYLRVPPITIKKASRFLDGVQREGGAFYGYVAAEPSRKFSTTSIGL